MTTETKANPAEDLSKLSMADLRARVLGDLEDAMENNPRFYRRFVAIVKCKAAQLEDKDDVLFTSVKMKQSAYEFGAKVSLGVKLTGGDLTSKYKPRGHYLVQLREAPTDPEGRTINLKLDGEVGSVLVVCQGIGRKEAGGDGEAAVIDFRAYEPKEEDADAGAAKCSLSLAVDGAWFMDRWELGQVYRLAILPAPKWLESEDKRRREIERQEKAERKAARERKALEKAAKAGVEKNVHPDQLGIFGDGPGNRPEPGAEEAPGEAEAVATLFKREVPKPAVVFDLVAEDEDGITIAPVPAGWSGLEAGEDDRVIAEREERDDASAIVAEPAQILLAATPERAKEIEAHRALIPGHMVGGMVVFGPRGAIEHYPTATTQDDVPHGEGDIVLPGHPAPQQTT